mmetsp:Transcript_20411/g.56572  ORF Transcript_20411/g.56572 Transcript_20411/m.56572 type:complete len:291 (-) Transcript_20411:516-1388(-)
MRALVAVFVSAVLFAAASNSETITGHIYCDNKFSFWFNGELVAQDPMSFTPHQAVAVSFEWDPSTPKRYAISCEDYATESGYEYVGTNSPQLGDGALLAKFSDGTVTNSDWKVFVTSHGPTAASNVAGCSKSNLGPCELKTTPEPSSWISSSYNASSWDNATQYTELEAGWGRTPSWQNGECCMVTSPLTRANVGCSVDPATGEAITVTESECLDPKAVLQGEGAEFIWSSDLKRDNKVLFVYEAGSASTESESDKDTDKDSAAGASAGFFSVLLLSVSAASWLLAGSWT